MVLKYFFSIQVQIQMYLVKLDARIQSSQPNEGCIFKLLMTINELN